MDIISEWEKLKKIEDIRLNQIIPFYESLLEKGCDGSCDIDFLSQIKPNQRKGFLKCLKSVLEGNIVEVGCFPQLGMALFASLYYFLKGKRVICIFSNILDFNIYSKLLRIYTEDLGISVGVKEKPSLDEINNPYSNDIVLVEYVRFIQNFYADRDFIKIRPTAAIMTEIDFCLYDRRLFVFAKKELTAIAAVYQTRSKKESWKEKKEILDFKEIVPSFENICGFCSSITPQVVKEITKIYHFSIKNIVKVKNDYHIPALVFKSRQEKFKILFNDVAKEKDSTLIFYYTKEGYQSLIEKFKYLNKSVVKTIINDKDLEKFFDIKEDKKVIGLVQGMVGLDLLPFFIKKKVKVILAEHAPFLHHHLKFKIFCKEKLFCQEQPLLYISLEDEVAKIYTDGADFSKSFNLIEFTEQRYSTRWMRKLIAKGILRRIYRLRSIYWDESNPMFTGVFNPFLDEFKKVKKIRKDMNKHISGLCFCGSGKKFKDCHGKL